MELLLGNEPIRLIQQFFGLGYPLPFRVLSLLGDTWGMIFVTGLAFWLWGRERMYAIVGAVVAGALTKQMLSMAFSQSRPEGPGIVVYEQLEVSSFPSGHVYEAIGPWGLLYVLGCLPLWLAAAVPIGVSLGRMYLGTHYLGDVLGAFAFGIPFVWLFVKLWPAVRAWLGRRSGAFHLGLMGLVLAAAAGWLIFVGGGPRRYEIIGMALAGSVALGWQSRSEHDLPVSGSRRERTFRVLIGLAGISAFLLLDRSGPPDARLLGTFAAGGATLWALLGAPALFRHFGSGERRAADRAAVTSGRA